MYLSAMLAFCFFLYQTLPVTIRANNCSPHLQQRAIVPDHGRLPDDHPGAMVQQDALADARSRMDVHSKHLPRWFYGMSAAG